MENSRYEKINRTRFPDLGFTKIAPGLWMFIARDTPGGAQIGPQYTRKDELLADLAHFATERGYT